VHLWHFSDAPDAEQGSREPVGGAARMATAIRQAEAALGGPPLILFSGGAYGGSDASVATRGEHSAAMLGALGVQCAVTGHCELRMGLDTVARVARASSFPWLLSNATARDCREPVPGTQRSYIVEHMGVKVGILGLYEDPLASVAESAFPVNPAIPPPDPPGPHSLLDIQSPDDVARQLATELRRDGAELVIALSHCSHATDRRVCAQVPEIDLLLGGHFQSYDVRPVAPHMTWMVHSGGRLRSATLLTLWVPDSTGPARRARVECKRIDVTSHFPADPETTRIMTEWSGKVLEEAERVVGYAASDLDATSATMSNREAGTANLVLDVFRQRCEAAGGAEVALLPGSTWVCDRVIPAGPLLVGDVLDLLPAREEMCVVNVPGATLVALLERGLRTADHSYGGFVQVSGVTFSFNASKPPGRRLVTSSVLIGGRPLDPGEMYRVATSVAFAHGDHLRGCPLVVPPAATPTLALSFFDHLWTLAEASRGGAPETKQAKAPPGLEGPEGAGAFGEPMSLPAEGNASSGPRVYQDSEGTVGEADSRRRAPSIGLGVVEAGLHRLDRALAQSPRTEPGAEHRAGFGTLHGHGPGRSTREGVAAGSGVNSERIDTLIASAPARDTAPAKAELQATLEEAPMCVWLPHVRHYAVAPAVDGRISNVHRKRRDTPAVTSSPLLLVDACPGDA